MNYNDYFDYVDGRIFWKVKIGRARIGNEVGYVGRGGYRIFELNSKPLITHRVIWEMLRGAIPPGMEIDHIDHDKLNNRIENLRVVSHKDNMKNKSKYKANKSGFNGVGWHKRIGKWQSIISDNGRQIFIGYFDSTEEAHLSRIEKEKELKFHKNHGDK